MKVKLLDESRTGEMLPLATLPLEKSLLE